MRIHNIPKMPIGLDLTYLLQDYIVLQQTGCTNKISLPQKSEGHIKRYKVFILREIF